MVIGTLGATLLLHNQFFHTDTPRMNGLETGDTNSHEPLFERFIVGLEKWLTPSERGWMLQSEAVARSGKVLGASALEAVPISCVALVQVNTGDESMDFIRATYVVPDEKVVSWGLAKLRISSAKERSFPCLESLAVPLGLAMTEEQGSSAC